MKLLLLPLLPMWLLAVPLSTLVENSKTNHTSLRSIEQRVSAIDNDIAISKNFVDPLLSINISDIQLDDISNRSIEPMQFISLSYQQKISYFGKRDAMASKRNAQKYMTNLTLDAMQVKLVEAVKRTAYSIWQKEEQLKITNQYITLTKQNIELYSAFSTSDSKSHMSIMAAEMTLSELRIKTSRLKSSLKGLYSKLSYLSATEHVNSVEMDVIVSKPVGLQNYIDATTNNVAYQVKEASLQVTQKDIKVKELNKYSDPILKLGYYSRDTFKDYVNVGISFSLPLYSTQDHMIEKSKKLSLAKENEITDFNALLHTQITQVYAQLEESYEIHTIIQDESMPQIQHMFELSSSSIKSGDELFIYISLLEKKLALDEKNIGVVAQYNKNKATLDALIGSIQ
ncbi:TolC family protein [Sulfurimonas sp. SAG-AH-194-I05]|nr:TolC family protein [Sulfurimonas sp. SAG-AH-194-I05]MDF1874256.1 TolC family protein [Sulfurimonas sp. SAG-AH-194-I05]